jgi:uncharacterized DUF497 family protein
MAAHKWFEWNDAKAKANLRRHRVNFSDATRVLGDAYASDFHVEEYDAAHSEDEDRYVNTGSDPPLPARSFC